MPSQTQIKVQISEKVVRDLVNMSKSMSDIAEQYKSLYDSSEKLIKTIETINNKVLSERKDFYSFYPEVKRIFFEIRFMNEIFAKLDDKEANVTEMVLKSFSALASNLENIHKKIEANKVEIDKVLGEVDESQDKTIN